MSLTLKDATGNSATATLSLVVDASAMEAIKANPDPTDVGVPVVFQAEIQSGPGGLTYDWTFGDGYASSTASPVHTYQATGSYLVNVTATAPGGGQINASILIGVAPDLTTPVVTANPLTPELGQLVNLTARELAGAPPYSYSWAFGDGGVGGNMSAISHIFTTSGPFSTVVTVTDRTGQRISGSLNLSIALNLTILGNWSAGAAPLEIGFASQARGGSPAYGYAWSFGDGGTSTVESPVHTFSEAGAYVVRAHVSDGSGHTAESLWSVLVAPGGGALATQLTVSPQPPAPGSSVEVTSSVSGGVGGYSYAWGSSGGACSPQTIALDICSIPAAGAVSVTLTVTDAQGHRSVAQVTIQSSGSAVTSPGRANLGADIPWIVLGLVATIAAVVSAITISRRSARSVEARGPLANPEYRVGQARESAGSVSPSAQGQDGQDVDSAPDLV